MSRTNAARYAQLLALAEDHYTRQGFVKWSDLATELGVSRQRILQMMQQAICLGVITGDDLDRYRSADSRRKAAQSNQDERRALERLKVKLVLTPENLRWLDTALEAAPAGTSRCDLINTAITNYRTHA